MRVFGSRQGAGNVRRPNAVSRFDLAALLIIRLIAANFERMRRHCRLWPKAIDALGSIPPFWRGDRRQIERLIVLGQQIEVRLQTSRFSSSSVWIIEQRYVEASYLGHILARDALQVAHQAR
jgi:hypothetical protein